MNRDQARREARTIMDAAGLTRWSFRFDHAKRRAGSCTHSTRTITLSGPLVDLYDVDTVRGVILHEVAHALVGPDHHHDAVWKKVARGLGAPDSARLSADLPKPVEPWVGHCPMCDAQRKLFRAPRRVTACGHCSSTFDAARILEWTHNGVPASPGAAYERELRSIQRRLK
ncbi:SprT-like domain-containing protein [Schaalia vaccimaxillae]|uniref:SprT-like domain-containing protein n=1 Tax=Schaalia vaccimaxillae TaxID=183916 RepID=UPI0003B392F4|nr:SprT-like domain-containing protein [Schaalia vaccimaxillae]